MMSMVEVVQNKVFGMVTEITVPNRSDCSPHRCTQIRKGNSCVFQYKFSRREKEVSLLQMRSRVWKKMFKNP